MGRFINYPVRFMLEIDLFAELFEKYDPKIREHIDPAMTLQNYIDENGNEAFMADLERAMERYKQETKREVQEFGVDLDPDGPRYLWRTPEEKEAAVRLIEEQYPLNEGDVICYGPSNITYWYSLEQDMLPYKAQNHGMGGCIDPDMIHYAPRILYPYKPSVVFFQTGSNDIAAGIPLETVLANKKRMYDLFLENMPETQLVVCSGLPLPGRTHFWEATRKTNALLKEMCEKTERMHFMDATDAMLCDKGEDRFKIADGVYFNPELYRIDKIHLNKKGHDVWTGLMKEMLKHLI